MDACRYATHENTGFRAAPRAFTLVELLVVIGIIGLLVGITFAVGRTVVNSSKRQATEDTLRILDTALQAYMDKQDALPPAYMWQMDAVKDPAAVPAPLNTNYFVCVDGVGGAGGALRPVNSVGMFMVMASQVPEAKAILDKLPSRFVRTFDIDGAGGANPQPEMPTVFDAWGSPIRFVLPALDGRIVGARGDSAAAPDATRLAKQAVAMPDFVRNPYSAGLLIAPNPLLAEIRRNGFVDQNLTPNGLPDSDGSRSTNNRPYFYSAGDDGRVGEVTPAGAPLTERLDYNADNVYTTKPTLPRKQG
jgi:prepilin-type N-terminal cleavage/methylation domain-containing protein